ncbi:hypothetical protein SUNI508_06149 [Seiridium unicorne]|uniref:Pheromone n=1 Tax=Seiridium unicorne TaxID=138068 RepID=A0ABR2V338_9PEZI
MAEHFGSSFDPQQRSHNNVRPALDDVPEEDSLLPPCGAESMEAIILPT